MTLDEAIDYCEIKAEIDNDSKQFYEWLKELKKYKEKYHIHLIEEKNYKQKGTWIHIENNKVPQEFKCSICNRISYFDFSLVNSELKMILPKICPWCKSTMTAFTYNGK